VDFAKKQQSKVWDRIVEENNQFANIYDQRLRRIGHHVCSKNNLIANREYRMITLVRRNIKTSN
jgi:hypothetical protein